jgi:hypothetical protein
MKTRSSKCVLTLAIAFFGCMVLNAQTYTLSGKIKDQQDALVPAAQLVLRGMGAEQRVQSGEQGDYKFANLRPGKYTVRTTLQGFGKFEKPIEVNGNTTLDITLVVSLEKQEVDVTDDERGKVGVDPTQNAGALVLRGADLDTLSDDPDQLASDLQALAGPSAGPNGGQIFIDGFSGGQLPPKSAIREIRINSNPYSAEFDRQGFGRIEILTKPGADRFRGQASFGFNDSVFNSRNPFLEQRAPFQARTFGFNFGGPLNKKTSFSVDADNRQIDDNAVINATVLDAGLNPSRFQNAIVTPQRRLSVTPRLDYALSTNNTLVGRYSFTRLTNESEGIGQFSLGSRAYDRIDTDHTIQLTETSILNPNLINETRFQFNHSNLKNTGDNTIPTIQVLDAFTGGGAQIGAAYNTSNSIELNNISTRTWKQHTFKFGGRLRWSSLSDFSPNNFGGTFVFAGGVAPVLNDANEPIPGQTAIVTSLERYRRTLFFNQQGLSPSEVRLRGGGATQFTINGGNPLADVNQTDIGLFFTDDWRLKPNVTVSAGLRYEAQTNVNNYSSFAPRVSLAWGVGQKGRNPAKFVIRAGSGFFYDRIAQNLALQALRFNGTTQQNFIVPNPEFFPVIPSLSAISQNVVAQTVRQLASDIQAPVLMQNSLGIERQVTKTISMNVNFVNTRGVHSLRTRNINSPLPNGTRPYGPVGNIFQYESTGFLRQNQLIIGGSARPNRKITLFGSYVLQDAKSDTDGLGSFPAYTYDLNSEYGPSSFNTRHRLFLGGSLSLWKGVTMNPFVTANSGRPFNIVTGRDTNGDTVFNERPSLTSADNPNRKESRYGIFNPTPGPNDPIIGRNYAVGPGAFSVNLRMSRTWGFGKRGESGMGPAGMPPGMDGGGGRGGPGGGGGGGMRGGGGGGPMGGMMGGMGGGRPGGPGGFGGGMSEKRFNLTLSVSARNLFNTVNLAPPVGNLSSGLFGLSTATSGGGFGGGPGGGGDGSGAGNRRIDVQLRFSF